MLSKGDKKLFLIDAYALIYRAYFAFSKNPRITSKGFDTSAIYGFTNILFDLINTEDPTHLGVVFDTPQKTHRHVEYVEYKANRDAMPEGISTAIPYIKEILNAFNIPILFVDGFEADDVIGTLAKQAEKINFQTYMLTPDKDFAQLVSEKIFMFRPGNRGNPNEIWDVKKVCEKFDVKNTNQVIDFLGMVGDSVDNIPGIAGVGPKTASKLLKTYGSIENLYTSVQELEGKLKEKVENGKESAFLSKKLATIITDVPIQLDVSILKCNTPNLIELKKIFDALEFRRIYERISRKFSSNNRTAQASSNSIQLDMFAVDTVLTNSIIEKGHRISSLSELKDVIKKMSTKKELTFFLASDKDNLVGMSFSDSLDSIFYIIFNNSLSLSTVLREFTTIFNSEIIDKNFLDSKKIRHLLSQDNILCAGTYFDISIADYLIHPDSNRSFPTLIQKYNLDTINLDLLNISIEKDKISYLIEGVSVLMKIKSQQNLLLQQNNFINLFYNIELPLVHVLCDMEQAGISLDTNLLNQYSNVLNQEIQKLESHIYDFASEKFNIGSPKQLGDILFNKMKLSEKPKKTKSGQFATGEQELIKLKGRHPIIDSILLFRTYNKLLSTYVNALPLLISSLDGKIHTTFNQTVASTGRLSSSNPNLQNIPIRRQSGKDVRRAFIPSKDHILMCADYSQIELRLIAEFSKEDNMIDAFLNNEDIHTATASKVFQVKLSEVTQEMRSNAKVVNFGIIYGVSAFGLSEQSSLNRKQAADLIETYFKTYPKLKSFINNQISFAKEHGYVETILGRKRYLRNINSRNSFIRGHDERNAVNMPIQGSAADMIKLAMIKIHKEFHNMELKSKMVLQVHDELVFDVYSSEQDIVKEIVKRNMENVYPTSVPLKVDIGFGQNWLEAH
ncbi:MAG: DNA polymerase I [Flavobacteriales bacterium]|mgnify:CR=1 FL=1|nr:DNA polymerase I [Flavobacteriales bacterium]